MSDDPKEAHEVIAAVAEVTGHTAGDIYGPRRPGPLAHARQIAMYVAREVTGLSYPQLGRAFGRHHTTVLHGVERIERLLAEGRLVAEDRWAVRREVSTVEDSTDIDDRRRVREYDARDLADAEFIAQITAA